MLFRVLNFVNEDGIGGRGKKHKLQLKHLLSGWCIQIHDEPQCLWCRWLHYRGSMMQYSPLQASLPVSPIGSTS